MEQVKVNVYNPDAIADMSAKYIAAPNLDTVKELALHLNVTERSVIAKLSSLGIYVKKTYVTKAGTAPVRKEVYIDRIATLLDIDASLLECLEKATKQALVAMESRIQAMHEVAYPGKPTIVKVD
jgi:hypothetical protein